MPRSRFRRGRRALPALLAGLLAVAGCARFPDTGQGDFTERPQLQAEAGPTPRLPELDDLTPPAAPAPGGASGPTRPQGCTDPDPQVVATCLNPVSAIAVLPGGQSALVAERTTGRVLRVERGKPPKELARLAVDPAGDGGLTALMLSPTYGEDELIYAYITTPADNRVVRLLPGDAPKPVVVGIPRGRTANRGAITSDAGGALLVATGDAGDPARAATATSLGGKVLRIDEFGKPLPDNPDPASRVLATGLRSPGGLCGDPRTGQLWVTDRTGPRDVLYAVTAGRLSGPAWSWPDRPGVSGCAAAPGLLAVALTATSGVYVLHPVPDGTFTGNPETVLKGTYGHLTAATIGPGGLVWLGTTNRGTDLTVSSDDRVIRIQPPAGGSSGLE